ncbi:histidinol-phosphatase, inositol monophosphatase family [Cognatiyoonia sediminum]|uniref:Histidinol-phosphatase n=1 Tax=Cognatiyoonia sediminum TaxID=1508389 RepID=A0A1M5N8C1_9RHOB|nr:histidinol-phosphatase [Cognatiyoonia sediminum]SHG85727.1 histidinol-phosphatase, inositol monophosphatase family [Cognatiyoonia sediminum]
MTTWNTETISDVIRVAHLAADAAKSETLKFFRGTNLSTENKDSGGFDPVTAADRAAEQAIRSVLAAERPQDGILGEEFGTSEGETGLTWVLDPIDGTRGYISGTPTWGTLISVADESEPKFGLIDQPYIGERFLGGLGVSSMTGPLGEKPLGTRETDALTDATLLTTFPEVGTDLERRAFEAVDRQVKLTRYGMDCYGYALLAAGQVDLVIEAGLQAYDIQAPIAVIEGAGGIVTNWEGQPAHEGGRVVAAANETLHAQALALVRSVVDG